MSKNSKPKNSGSGIGENTRWDIPQINPNAGSTIRKPPTNLNPKTNGPKK